VFVILFEEYINRSEINNRLRDDFFGTKVMELLEKIHDLKEFDDLKKSYRLFIHTIIEYIEDRASFYESISIFSQTNYCDENKLCSDGECDVEASSDSDSEEDIRYHKNLKEHPYVRCGYLWTYRLHSENVPEFKKLVQFVFSIPAFNAFCESVFSHMKYLWNNNRNRMKHDLVGAELKIKVNAQYNCIECYDHLLKIIKIY
jgi:hypothetical protein